MLTPYRCWRIVTRSIPWPLAEHSLHSLRYAVLHQHDTKFREQWSIIITGYQVTAVYIETTTDAFDVAAFNYFRVRNSPTFLKFPNAVITGFISSESHTAQILYILLICTLLHTRLANIGRTAILFLYPSSLNFMSYLRLAFTDIHTGIREL